jgi:hypothetical protein
LLVHNDIHYVPTGDGWREVLVRTGAFDALNFITYGQLFFIQKLQNRKCNLKV